MLEGRQNGHDPNVEYREILNPHSFALMSGSGHPALADQVGKLLGRPCPSPIQPFSTGEFQVMIPDIQAVYGKKIAVLQSMPYPQGHYWFEMFGMARTLKQSGAEKVFGVLAHTGFARGDRADQPGQSEMAKLTFELAYKSGFDQLVGLNLHSNYAKGVFPGPYINIPGYLAHWHHLNAWATNGNGRKKVLVAPDDGQEKTVRHVSQLLGIDSAVIDKIRISDTKTTPVSIRGDVDDAECLMIDDETTTGGTLKTGAAFLSKHGAYEVDAMVTHWPEVEGAVEGLAVSEFRNIFVTDSIPRVLEPEFADRFTVSPIAPVMSFTLRALEQGRWPHEMEYLKFISQPNTVLYA